MQQLVFLAIFLYINNTILPYYFSAAPFQSFRTLSENQDNLSAGLVHFKNKTGVFKNHPGKG
ncbi:MAG TPA: hypothetical protein VF421_00955 [Niabella sp.]